MFLFLNFQILPSDLYAVIALDFWFVFNTNLSTSGFLCHLFHLLLLCQTPAWVLTLSFYSSPRSEGDLFNSICLCIIPWHSSLYFLPDYKFWHYIYMFYILLEIFTLSPRHFKLINSSVLETFNQPFPHLLQIGSSFVFTVLINYTPTNLLIPERWVRFMVLFFDKLGLPFTITNPNQPENLLSFTFKEILKLSFSSPLSNRSRASSDTP